MMIKKLWLLASLTIVMSLTTGLAFGHWTDLANVNAKVSTGTACVSIIGIPTQADIGPDYTIQNVNLPLDLVTNPLVPYQCDGCNTNIGSCSATIVDGDLHIVLNNVYPTYANEFSFDLSNCGTVPMEITNVTFIPENNTAGTTTITTQAYLTLDLNGDGKADIEIVWAGAIGNVICPGHIPLENSFYVHFLEPVPQHVTLILDIHVNFQNCESTNFD